MSVEALTWAFNLAPVPADKSGKPSSACAAVLAGLANHADSEGIGAFPSVPTLVRYTRLSERTVRTSLDRLAAAKIIKPCDPAIVAARIHRKDRRPQGWDLDLTLIRDDLTDDDIANLQRQFPGLRGQVDAMRAAAQADDSAAGSEVQPPHPVPSAHVKDESHEVQQLHPAEGTGCNERSHGVQLTQQRGAAVAPKPSIEPPREPSKNPPPAVTRASGDPPPAENPAAGGDPRLLEFFDRLGPAWPLSPAHRNRLTPAVGRALDLGWQPQALAEYVGANTTGVRNPYAVLGTRLRPEQLPAPHDPEVSRLTPAEAENTTKARDGQAAAPVQARLSAADRRQLEIDQLEADMFGTIRGVPVRAANEPDGPVLRLVPEWADSADRLSSPPQRQIREGHHVEEPS